MKVGSDESHFNVTLIVRDKVTRQYPQTTTFEASERRAQADSNRGPSAYQPTALPLGQAGSLPSHRSHEAFSEQIRTVSAAKQSETQHSVSYKPRNKLVDLLTRANIRAILSLCVHLPAQSQQGLRVN